MPIISLSIAMLIGICLYAGLYFLLHYLRVKRTLSQNNLYLIFSLMCFLITGYMGSELFAYHQQDPHSFVLAFKWRDSFSSLFLALWPWFVFKYTSAGSRRFVACGSLFYALYLIPVLVRPYGAYFDVLPSIVTQHSFWGEQISFIEKPEMNIYSNIMWSSITILVLYTFYACYVQFQNGLRGQAATLALAMTIFICFIFENFLVRTGFINFIFLAQYGFPALVIIMSIALQRETYERIQRASLILDHVPSVLYIKDAKGKYLLVNKQFESVFALNRHEIIGKTDYEIFNSENALPFNMNDQDVLSQDKAVDLEETTLHADNTLHTYHSIKFPLFDSRHKSYASCGISTDITKWQHVNRQFHQSESKYRTLYEAAGEAIFLMQDNIFTDCNPKALEMFGCVRKDIIGKTFIDFTPSNQYAGESSIELAIDKINKALKGEPQSFKWLHCQLNGTLFDAEVSLNRIDINNQAYIQTIVKDVTARKRSEDALRYIAIGVTGDMRETGDEFYQQMVNHLAKSFGAKYAFIGLLDDNDSTLINTIAMSMDGETAENISYSLQNSPNANVTGQKIYSYPENVQSQFPKDALLRDMAIESYIAAPLYNVKKILVGLIVVLDTKPITELDQVKSILEIFAARASAEIERLKAEYRIHKMAYRDYLTGLANRAAFHEHISKILKTSRRKKISGAMLLIDLDHFKTINDALSHDVGDNVLKLVSQRLSEIRDGNIFLARMGGDEFAAIITDEHPVEESSFVKHIQKVSKDIVTMLSKPLYLDNRILSIGASIGVVLFPQQGNTELDIIRRADMALYRAKNSGRGNVQFFIPALQDIVDDRLQIERGLRHAIDNNELVLNYQPQFDKNGQYIGAEALLRWQHIQLGPISAQRFIPIAEESGLIHAIGEWVINETCRQIHEWQSINVKFDHHIAINVSAWQFANPDFIKQVIESMAKYKIQPHQIVLELTETTLLHDIDEAIIKLEKFRSIGIKIALDDFGTGYSSLAYLKDMPLDFLKIDKIFVRELSIANDHPLVETIIVMGQHMHLDVIAEGVETATQRDVLTELGCKKFQGYYFSKPLCADDFTKLLRQTHRVSTQRLA